MTATPTLPSTWWTAAPSTARSSWSSTCRGCCTVHPALPERPSSKSSAPHGTAVPPQEPLDPRLESLVLHVRFCVERAHLAVFEHGRPHSGDAADTVLEVG